MKQISKWRKCHREIFPEIFQDERNVIGKYFRKYIKMEEYLPIYQREILKMEEIFITEKYFKIGGNVTEKYFKIQEIS